MRRKVWALGSLACLGGCALMLASSCSTNSHDFGSSSGGDGQGGEQPAGVAGTANSVSGSPTTAGNTGNTAGTAGSGGSSGTAGSPAMNGGEGGQGDSCAFVTCDCEEGATRPCGPKEAVGICKPGSQTCVQGGWGECVGAVEPKGRDCTASTDNDCDGKPDNTIDAACKCVPGAKEACGEHPGNDGNGPCKAGERVCSGSGSMGIWGPCTGSVAPKATDSCSVKGDDANCDGQKNGACTCLSGDKSNCLDVYGSKGVCSPIALTCTDAGKWPSSTSCTAASGPELCAGDSKDENCDGQVNEGCDCVNGVSKVCGGCNEGMQACVGGKYQACDAKPNDLKKGPVMLCIPPANNVSIGSNRNSNELPVHTVNFAKGFWMDESEVTLAQYTACVNDANKCSKGEDITYSTSCTTGSTGKSNFPINCVDQIQATAFCTWAGKRLPTEEEWEYAAKGTTTRKYPWGDTFTNQANLRKDVGVKAVKQYPSGKSPFGLFDMSGNVQEWTSSPSCPYDMLNCGYGNRVWRGGSYSNPSATFDEGTTTYRNNDDPNNTRYGQFGFRCAKDQ